MFETATTVEGWIRLARSSAQAALLLKDNEATRNQAWTQAGFAVECILKASIMARERMNQWPTRGERRDLYVHDLRKLGAKLGVAVAADDAISPAWHIVLQWQRDHTYVANLMQKAVVRDIIDAALGSEGVIPWLCQSYLRSYVTPEENIWLGSGRSG